MTNPPAGLLCGSCARTADAVKVNGVWSDPPGWSCLTLSGTPMLHRTLCPVCSDAVRILITPTPPRPAPAESQAAVA